MRLRPQCSGQTRTYFYRCLLHSGATVSSAAFTASVARILPVGVRRVRSVWRLSLARRHLGASGDCQHDEHRGEPSQQVHCTEIGEIRLGSLFLTLPTRVLTGQQVTSSAGQGGAIHSMTSSARARMEGEIVRPSAAAVLRLITSSNLAGCSTGKSAGLAPERILPTNVPPRLFRS